MRKREGRSTLEETGVDGSVIIIKQIFNMWCGGCLDLTHLAQDMNRGRAVVNAVMNLRFS